MAIIKQKEVKTIRMVKKETTLNQELWGLISSYIKFAGIKGSQVDKRNFVVEGALKHLFENDKEFQDYIGKAEALKEESRANVAEVKKGLIETHPKK